MKEDKKNINDINPAAGAKFLLREQTIGGYFRDKHDLNNAKHLSLRSLCFFIDILKNFDGSLDDKISFLNNMRNEVNNFYVDDKNP